MCNLSQGVAERAMEKGRNDALLQAIKNVMDSFKVSADAAIEALHIPDEDRAKYKAMLHK